MCTGIRSGLAASKICKAMLLGVVTIAMVIPGSHVAFGQNTAKSLGVFTSSPVELILTDPQGRRTGFDPVSNTSFQEIPTSAYSSTLYRDDQNLSAPDPPPFKALDMANPMDGQYTVDVIGTGTGDFTVGVRISDAAGNWITHFYYGTTVPGHISRFSFPGEVNTFAAFEASLKISPASGVFEVNGAFTLGPRGTISPVTQPVSIELHDFLSTIPAGSFKQTQQGTFTFAGVIQGIQLAAELTLTGGKSYTFQIRGAGGPQPSGLPSDNPVRVGLAIGSNGGSASVNANFAP